jgi:hypothetical protein
LFQKLLAGRIAALGKTPWSSGKGEDSCSRGCEFEFGPAVETIYHAPLIWIKGMKAKIVEKVT